LLGRLGKLTGDNGCIFFLETEKNHCLETETLNWQRLDQLGIIPGISLYILRRKSQKNSAAGFDIACK
jgi:hypothetical protein